MLEIAIVGAGICGLTLGRELAARGVSFALFEARERLGGRVLSVQNPTNGERLDLGPTWFWPDTQPAVSRLADELGLERFDQYDPGSALLLSDPEEPPATRATPRLHAGAQRLKGGMASLVESLAAAIPQEALHLGCVLREAIDRGDHIELLFDAGGEVVTVAARQVVLAVPPRLLAEQVRFTPALPERRSGGDERDADMDGRSGQGRGRLFGASSLARSGTFRQRLRGSRSGRARRNLRRLRRFRREGGAWRILRSLGANCAKTSATVCRCSWRANSFSYSARRSNPANRKCRTGRKKNSPAPRPTSIRPTAHPDYGSTALRQSRWDGKLYLGASETAREGGGYIEGAINAAIRIRDQLFKPREDSVMTTALAPASPDLDNQRCLERFGEWVASRQAPTFASYRQRLNYALSHGQREQLTQRAMLGAMEAVFTDALAFLEELPFSHDGVADRARPLRSDAQSPGGLRGLHSGVAGRDHRLQPDILRSFEFPGGAPPGEGLHFDDATRHRRRLAGVFAVREPTFAREARCARDRRRLKGQ